MSFRHATIMENIALFKATVHAKMQVKTVPNVISQNPASVET
jgi:hypothetical protein